MSSFCIAPMMSQEIARLVLMKRFVVFDEKVAEGCWLMREFD